MSLDEPQMTVVDVYEETDAQERARRERLLRPEIRRRRPSLFGRACLWASGADREALAALPHERYRFAALGGTVFMSGLLSATGIALALHTIAQSLSAAASVLIAIVWGAVTVNFERWLIAMHGSTPGRFAVWRRLSTAIVQVVLAIVFGLVIAEPLVLSIFHADIQVEILKQRDQDVSGVTAQYRKQINAIDGQVSLLQLRLSEQLTNPGGENVATAELRSAISQLQRQRVALTRSENAASNSVAMPEGFLAQERALSVVHDSEYAKVGVLAVRVLIVTAVGLPIFLALSILTRNSAYIRVLELQDSYRVEAALRRAQLESEFDTDLALISQRARRRVVRAEAEARVSEVRSRARGKV